VAGFLEKIRLAHLKDRWRHSRRISGKVIWKGLKMRYMNVAGKVANIGNAPMQPFALCGATVCSVTSWRSILGRRGSFDLLCSSWSHTFSSMLFIFLLRRRICRWRGSVYSSWSHILFNSLDCSLKEIHRGMKRIVLFLYIRYGLTHFLRCS